MASTNKTSNLELSQFIATDTPTWLVDYNGDMEKIDAGVGRVEELAETASTQAVGVASGLQTTNQNVTTLSGQVANVQNQANNNTASVNGINQRLGNTDISGVGDGTITGAINTLNSGTKISVKRKEYSVNTNDNGIGTILFDGYCIGFGNNQGYVMFMTINEGAGASFIFKTVSGSIGSNMAFDGVIYYI